MKFSLCTHQIASTPLSGHHNAIFQLVGRTPAVSTRSNGHRFYTAIGESIAGTLDDLSPGAMPEGFSRLYGSYLGSFEQSNY
jgi:hypothetical protein